MDDAAKRRALVRQFEEGRDLDETHEMYHDDAVLEFRNRASGSSARRTS